MSINYDHFLQPHKDFVDAYISFQLIGFIFEDFESVCFLFSILIMFDNIWNEHVMLRYHTFLVTSLFAVKLFPTFTVRFDSLQLHWLFF